ncbi:MAG: RluA family pseudouridine synthase [Bacilli bacterium]|nr:RluA family pseudouridine synthase [Bacilli bacterium]
MKEYICKKEDTLLSFLEKENAELSHKKIKNLLTFKKIKINGKIVSQYNYPLKPKDRIEISLSGHKSKVDLDILYEDKDLLVLYKRAGLLTIATEREKEKTLYHKAVTYVKEENKNNLLFVIHRLDKETSGIVVFAKNTKIKTALQENWSKYVTKRGYYAVIEGKLEKKSGTIMTYLTENEHYKVYSTTKEKGKLAITKFKVLKEGRVNSLLDVHLDTGRKNQIRVHFSEIGHPIIGDLKYGTSKKKGKQMGLHAYELEFMHPFTHKKMFFKTDMPRAFKDMLR